MSFLDAKAVAVSPTVPTKLMSKGESPYGSPVVIQCAININVYVGGPTVDATKGVLIPTAAAGGAVPFMAPWGGLEIWALSPSGTSDVRVAFMSGAATEKVPGQF